MIDAAYQALAAILRDTLPALEWSEAYPRLSGQSKFPAGFLIPAEAQNTSDPGVPVVATASADIVLWVRDDPTVPSRKVLHGYLDALLVALTATQAYRVDSWVFSNGSNITELSIHVELIAP